MFRFEDNDVSKEQQMIDQCNAAGQDLADRLGFIFQANHGMLDRNEAGVSGMIRFVA